MALASGSTAVVAHLAPLVATLLLTILISYWVARRRWSVRGARTFVGMLLVGGVVWPSLTVWHVLTASEPVLQFVVVADKFVGMTASALFVVFVSQYTNSGLHRRRVVQGVIGLYLGAFLVSWASNPWHGLLIGGFTITSGPFVYAGMQRGLLYWTLLVINYTILSASYYLVVDFLLTTREGARVQVGLLTLGALSVGTLNVLSIFELVPLPGFNYGSYGALPFLVFTTVSIFRLGLLDIVPIARKTLVETLTDPVLVVDDDIRVADYNEAAVELWPDLPEQVGSSLAAACPELTDQIDFPAGEETRTDEISLSSEGEVRHFSVLLSPVRKERRTGVVGYSILVRDVTELEASRRELERQNERLDRVAETISHDLRNPLNVASGRLDLLRAELADDEAAETHAAKVDGAHDRMAEIIEEVLTLAREGRGIDDATAVNVDAAAREAWSNVDTDGATLEIAFSGAVWADRGSLLTVFENLFRNAVEHGSTSPASQTRQDADGASAVEPSVADAPEDAVEHGSTSPGSQPRQDTDGASSVEPSVADAPEDAVEHGSTGNRPAADDAVEHGGRGRDESAAGTAERTDGGETTVRVGGFDDGFYVEDDGPGIPPEKREAVFEHGYTTTGDGTGFGLAIVETVAETHGWTVAVTDAPGGGARFAFHGVWVDGGD